MCKDSQPSACQSEKETEECFQQQDPKNGESHLQIRCVDQGRSVDVFLNDSSALDNDDFQLFYSVQNV